MEFTREPVIETVITPKEGYKLVVRSSKGTSQEEYFVDSVEVVSFGASYFYRSSEKPKCFFLPCIDYEILEVRETRMTLKHVSGERNIKIGSNRISAKEKETTTEETVAPSSEEPRHDRKRDKKRHVRKRRGKEEHESSEKVELPKSSENVGDTESPAEPRPPAAAIIRQLLSPPPLISETIGDYRKRFEGAFYEREEKEAKPEGEATPPTDAAPTSEISVTAPERPVEDLWNFRDEQ